MAKIKSFFSRLARGGLFVFKAEIYLWAVLLALSAVIAFVDALI